VTTIAPGAGSSARPAEPDPQAIATAVEACPSVARLSAGVGGEIATYLPGARVNGVRIRPDAVTVNVIAHWNAAASKVGDGPRSVGRQRPRELRRAGSTSPSMTSSYRRSWRCGSG